MIKMATGMEFIIYLHKLIFFTKVAVWAKKLNLF